ncbi:MAG: alpha/beta family hydrolase [Candidatus Nanoarchaeia archaeon]
MKAVLIPGANPAAAKKLFDMIKKQIPELEYIELSSASEPELLRARPAGDFIIIGKSMGGKLALEYECKEKDSRALILLSPAVYYTEKYASIKAKTLIVHGTADDVVPIENSEKLAKTIEGATLIKIEGGDHSYRGQENKVVDIIKNWLREQGIF